MVLEKLHAHADDPQHIGAREEFAQIRGQLALEKAQPSPNIVQLLFDRRYRKRMLYGFYLQAMCQSTGVLVISNYMVLELNNLGLSGSLPLLLLAVYNSWAAVLNYINALLIDRIGRIRIITIGCASYLSCLIKFPVNECLDGMYTLPLCGDGAKCSLRHGRKSQQDRTGAGRYLHVPVCHVLRLWN